MPLDSVDANTEPTFGILSSVFGIVNILTSVSLSVV